MIAYDCHNLAKALFKQNRDFNEALVLSRRAIEIHTLLKSAQETLTEIEEAIRKP